MIPVQTGGVLLLLRGDLTTDAVTGIGGRLDQILPLLLDPLCLLPLLIEAVQQRAEAVSGHIGAVIPVLVDRTIGKVNRLAATIQHCWCKAIFINSLPPCGKGVPQAVIGGAVIAFSVSAADDLPGYQRGHGGELRQKPAVQRLLLTGKQRHKFLPCDRQRIALLLPGRQAVV